MAEKNINARVQHKHDVEANWLKASSFVPKQGEIVVYDVDSTHTYERIKIGDGTTVVGSLPFVNDEIRQALTSGATKVSKAETADRATTADSATNAQTAQTAVSAQTANSATIADTALVANSATKATQDGNGKVIADTYETKADAVNKLNEAKVYTDDAIANLDEPLVKPFPVTSDRYINVFSLEDDTFYYLSENRTDVEFETNDNGSHAIRPTCTRGVLYYNRHIDSSDHNVYGKLIGGDQKVEYYEDLRGYRTVTGSNNYFYLRADVSNFEYTPTYDYHPATKKYVDDSVAKSIVIPQSNWNQNDPTADDYIKNRTHWVEVGGGGGNTLEWDGNTDGLVYVPGEDAVGNLYKVSDTFIGKDDLVGGTITAGGLTFSPITESNIHGEVVDGIEMYQVVFENVFLLLTINKDLNLDGFIFEKGTYFFAGGGVYVSKLTVLSPVFGEEIVHKIDPKFISIGGYGYDNSEVLFDETVELTDMGDGIMGYVGTFPKTLENKTYKITYNGVSYDCVPFDPADLGMLCALGNAGPLGGTDTGEPFLMQVMDEDGDGVIDFMIADFNGATSASVKVEFVDFHTIDPKFLPETQLSDWNQNNPNGAGYIKNRTHWIDVEQGYTTIVDNQYSDKNFGVNYSIITSGVNSPLIEGNKYLVTFNGADYPCVAYFADGYVSLGDSRLLNADTDVNPMEAPFCLQYGEGWEMIGQVMLQDNFLKVWDVSKEANSHTVTVKELTETLTYHKLDLKYLPEAIADWEQTDSTHPGFIKNKPDEDDALALLEEMGLVQPALAADGSAYVDENGAFYSII